MNEYTFRIGLEIPDQHAGIDTDAMMIGHIKNSAYWECSGLVRAAALPSDGRTYQWQAAVREPWILSGDGENCCLTQDPDQEFAPIQIMQKNGVLQIIRFTHADAISTRKTTHTHQLTIMNNATTILHEDLALLSVGDTPGSIMNQIHTALVNELNYPYELYQGEHCDDYHLRSPSLFRGIDNLKVRQVVDNIIGPYVKNKVLMLVSDGPHQNTPPSFGRSGKKSSLQLVIPELHGENVVKFRPRSER